MNIEELLQAIKQAEVDLAFALAQGNGYAEDEAAERLARLESALHVATRSGGRPV